MRLESTSRAAALSAKYRRKRLVCGGIVVLILLVIWGNSLQSAESSSFISTGLLARLEALWLKTFGTDFPVSHHLLRKLGHFTEFFMLGAFITFAAGLGKSHCKSFIFTLLYSGLWIAMIDETIQYFSPGRSPQVNDILLDHAAFSLGLLLAYGICRAVMYRSPSR